MMIVGKISGTIGRNILGLVAISLLITLVSFLPLAMQVKPHTFDQDELLFTWPAYQEAVKSYLTELSQGDLGSLTIKMRYARANDFDIIQNLIKMASRSVQTLLPAVLIGTVLGVILGASTFFVPRWARTFMDSVNQVLFSLPDIFIVFMSAVLAINLNKLVGDYLITVADAGSNRIYFLPILCVSIPIGAYMYRYTINACREVLNQEFVRTARAKGLPNRHIFIKHVMRPALDSMLAIFPKMVAFSASSLIIVEIFYNIAGISWWFHGGIKVSNMSKLLATILILFAAFVIIINVVTSLLRLWVNPALRK